MANLGLWMHTSGAGWLMATLTNSPLLIALVQTMATVPLFIFVLPAGLYADHMSRARYLFFIQLFLSVVALALAVIVYLGWVRALSLLVLTFLFGSGIAFRMPAWQAAASELVPTNEVLLATSINNLNFNIGRCFGPAIGGFLISLTGFSLIFFLNTLSLFFWNWQKREPLSFRTVFPFWETLKSSIKNVLLEKKFRKLLCCTYGIMFFSSALWSLLPGLAKQLWHVNASGFGLLNSCLGGGAILAAFILPRLRSNLGEQYLLIVSIEIFAFSGLLSSILGSLTLIGVCLVFAGIGWGVLLSTLNAIVQNIFPSLTRARGISVYLLVFYAGMSIGSIAWIGDYACPCRKKNCFTL